MWIDPELLVAGRTEEMEYMVKMGVFEVVNEKECCDNGCKPRVEMGGQSERREMSFKIGVSRDQESQRLRLTTWTRRRIFTHAAVGKVEDACVNNDDRTR